MPTAGGYYYGVGSSDPRRWERCRQQAAAQMLAEGWNKHASKFPEVQQRRALRLWRTH